MHDDLVKSPPSSMHVDCVVITVTYNSAECLEAMLDSLPAASGSLSTRCIVIDNASADTTLSIAQRRPDVTVVASPRNLGYSGAINLGRRHVGRCSSLLVLNPDIVLEPGAIVELYEAAAQPGVGMAVPMLLDSDGDVYLTMRRDPGITHALGDSLFGERLAARPGWLSEPVRDLDAYAQPHDVAWASGTVTLISAACDADVGDWDSSRFFLYAEETDYAIRARRRGYRVRYVPSARVHHEEGASGRSPALHALQSVNRIRCYEKYHRTPATIVFRMVLGLGHLLRLFRRSDREALRAVLRRSRWRDLPGGVA